MMDQDDTGEPFGDDEIIVAMKSWEKLSHSEGVKAAEGALCYFEQQGVSAKDIIFCSRLCDEAATSVSYTHLLVGL